MPQQALGRQDEERQRIALQKVGLATKQVEVLRGRRAVHEPQVDVGGRLENALGSRARVLRALTLVPVRKQEDERGLQAPLGAAGGDELVEHHLRAVDEVSVLRFPDHEAIGFLDVVAELEPDRRVLGQRGVVDLERRPRLGEFLQRRRTACPCSHRGTPRGDG